MYFDLNIGEWEFENNYEDIYFLLHCLYNAKTELYDRTLTDMKSRYDPTEAFIDGWNKSKSNLYSRKLYDKCVKCIELKTKVVLYTDTGKNVFGSFKVFLHKNG